MRTQHYIPDKQQQSHSELYVLIQTETLPQYPDDLQILYQRLNINQENKLYHLCNDLKPYPKEPWTQYCSVTCKTKGLYVNKQLWAAARTNQTSRISKYTTRTSCQQSKLSRSIEVNTRESKTLCQNKTARTWTKFY